MSDTQIASNRARPSVMKLQAPSAPVAYLQLQEVADVLY